MQLKQELVPVRVRSDSSNIAEAIAERDRKNKVFSIADLGQGGGEGSAGAFGKGSDGQEEAGQAGSHRRAGDSGRT